MTVKIDITDQVINWIEKLRLTSEEELQKVTNILKKDCDTEKDQGYKDGYLKGIQTGIALGHSFGALEGKLEMVGLEEERDHILRMSEYIIEKLKNYN